MISLNVLAIQMGCIDVSLDFLDLGESGILTPLKDRCDCWHLGIPSGMRCCKLGCSRMRVGPCGIHIGCVMWILGFWHPKWILGYSSRVCQLGRSGTNTGCLLNSSTTAER